MKASLPIQIKLTEAEQRLFDQIDFSGDAEYQGAMASGNASRELMESLLNREAIPKVRMSYFTDPFPGGLGKSHLQVFESNLRDRNLFEDYGFVCRYLRYFILGPCLPKETMEEFCKIVNDDSDWGETLLKFVRKEVRNTEGTKRAYLPDEFYKLALECLPHGSAESVRKAAMQVR